MAPELKVNDIDRWSSLLTEYFPDCTIKGDPTELTAADGGDILVGSETILPYIQTIFFEEHLIELQMDQSTRTFFSCILDSPPEIPDEDDFDEVGALESSYELGEYLKEKEDIAITPLTPGVGSAKIRPSKQVILRYFSGTTAVEFGCTYKTTDEILGIPAIRINFPIIGRVNKSFRPYRVKAVGSVDASIVLHTWNGADVTQQEFQIVDISGMGLSFEISGEKHFLREGNKIYFMVMVSGDPSMKINGIIRHVSKVRDKRGYKNVCGVQFDLETRSLAAEIERLAAAVQRLQLRELAEKTYALSGVNLIK